MPGFKNPQRTDGAPAVVIFCDDDACADLIPHRAPRGVCHGPGRFADRGQHYAPGAGKALQRPLYSSLRLHGANRSAYDPISVFPKCHK